MAGCAATPSEGADRPIAALAGDRFILRDHTGARTIGGGAAAFAASRHREG
jgi:hypothetical protein